MNTAQSIAISNDGETWADYSGASLNESVGTKQISLTAAATGFLFSFREILVLISARWLNLGTELGVASGILGEVALLLLAALQACGPAVRPVAWILRVRCVRWVLFFLAFSFCSLAWSGTVSRLASSIYWSAMAADVVIVLLLLRTRTMVEVAHSVMKGYVVASCMLAAVAWMLPAESDLRLGDLGYFNTNQIGNLCAMGVFMAQFLASRKDGRWRVAMLFLALTLLRSLSKATLIAFVVSQCVLLIQDRSMTRSKRTVLIVAALALMMVFSGLINAYYNLYTTAGNQAETLTGRTGIWIYCLNAGLDKPWIGNGIDSMWKVSPPFGPELFEARHAENEVLQQFFAYGLVGIAMLAGIYGTLYQSIRKLPRNSSRAVLNSLLLFILIRGLAEAEAFDLLLPLWSITVIASYLARECGASSGLGAASFP